MTGVAPRIRSLMAQKEINSLLKNSIRRDTAVSAVRETSTFCIVGTADTALAHVFQRAVKTMSKIMIKTN